MLTDEELIDGLHSELAPLRPPADLVERLRAQAGADEGRRRSILGTSRDGRPRRVRYSLGVLAVAAATVLSLAIAVGALVLIGHRGPSPQAARHANRPGGPERAPTLAQLEANFAVLRRPQTAADRAARLICSRPCSEHAIPSLTRLARTLPDGSRVFLSVWRLRTSELHQPPGSYVLREIVVPRHRAAIIAAASIPDVPFVVGGNFYGLPSANVSSNAPLWTAVVPDHVTSVRWTFSCRRGGVPQPCRGRAASSLMAAEVTVSDNVAAARIPGTGRGHAGATFTEWLDTYGREIASFSGAGGGTTFPMLEKSLTARSRLRVTLTAAGLGGIRFGASPARLQQFLDPQLGPANGGYQTVRSCRVDRVLSWPILVDPATGLARTEELELFFGHGHFVGYQYGGSVLAKRGGGRHLRFHAVTAGGLALGDSIRVARGIYGRAFQTSEAQGGSWQVHTAQGTLRGYAYDPSTYGHVSSRSLVASIDAGDVGCPSVTP
ncbi:MAG TPA: hypothetical protein VG186_07960 [Solirubrobacteraceae bacterium]|nr:hypothetical protein [Solirubrobacteraceae bacterium]